MSGSTPEATGAHLGTPDDIVDAILDCDPRWVADPPPFYAALRSQAPVHRSERANAWIVSNYEDVLGVCRHRAISGRSPGRDPRFATSPMLKRFSTILTFLDPPEHTRNRGVTRARFTKRRVADQQDYIERLTDTVLAEACEVRSFDFMDDLANRILIGAICDLLGVPAADHSLFAEWNKVLLAAFFPGVPDEQLAEADAATVAIEDYLRGLMADRKQSPSGDADELLNLVVAARQSELALTEDEALGVMIMLLMAGADTTAILMASGTLALLANPEQMVKLRRNPDLVDNAIEEFVRYDSVAHVAFPRFATDDTLRLGGGSIAVAEGDQILLLWPAANRDPAKFERPDDLDIERANAKDNVGWGYGIHLCLGASLARLTARAAFTRMLELFAQIDVLEDPPAWIYNGNVRRIQRLPVSVVPA